MKPTDFEALILNSENVLFAPTFFMRVNKLKFVSSYGKIMSQEGSLRLYRYMRISNVAEIMNGTIRFDEPTRWQDPFEKLFYQKPVNVNGQQYYVLCLCFVYDANRGEESMWNTHGMTSTSTNPSQQSIIRATFNIQNLCIGLSYANPDARFYLAPVDYSMTRGEILKLWKNRKSKSYTSIEEFIGEMLLKRTAFSYENEMRLFAVSNNSFELENDTFGLINLKNNKSVITSITLPPLPINHSQPYNPKNYHKTLEDQGLSLREELQKAKYTGKIYQSRLYDIECRIENH